MGKLLPSWTLQDKVDDDGNALPLFFRNHGPSKSDPPRQPCATSEAAAGAIAGVADHLKCVVLNFLKLSFDGATDEEMQIALKMPGNTQRPRRIKLVELGLVVDSGSTRQTQSGRAAVVWKVK